MLLSDIGQNSTEYTDDATNGVPISDTKIQAYINWVVAAITANEGAYAKANGQGIADWINAIVAGQVTTVVATSDWDNYGGTGFYFGTSLSNACPGSGNDRFAIALQKDASNAMQWQRSAASGAVTYTRVKIAASWSPWVKFGAKTFLDLGDSPSSFSGQANKYPRVNSAETALEFIAATLLNLEDAPSSYTGQGGKILNVDPAASATATFVEPSGGAYENLVVKRASVSTVDIDADGVSLYHTGNVGVVRVTSVNLTADITASGANGLDTAPGTPEANSKKYAVWVIYNGTTVASLLSLSFTAPAMPSGYTYKRLVGWAYNNSSGNLWDFIQKGNLWQTLEANAELVVDTGTADVLTAVAPTAPSIATAALITPVKLSGPTVSTVSIIFSTNGTELTMVLGGTGQGVIALNSSLQFYYKRLSATGNAQVTVYGLYLNI